MHTVFTNTEVRLTIRGVVELDPADQFIITKPRTGRRHQVERMTWTNSAYFLADGSVERFGYPEYRLFGRNVKADNSLGATWSETVWRSESEPVTALIKAARAAMETETAHWSVLRNG